VILSLALIGCSDGTPVTAPPTPPAALPDVILVTLDTTRADRIGAWGYADAHTDTIDALAASGRRYAHAYSTLPLTIPSHATIFTGLYPPHLGIRDNGGGKLEDRFETLAERLHANGYTTAASVAAYVTTRAWGFDQGFDAYFDTIPEGHGNFWHASRPGDAVVDDALGWWNAQDGTKPRFLWVHLYDVHFPYHAVSPYIDASPNRPYDAALAYVDDQVARLVDAAKAKPTLFVIAADHGEGLGDHGELMHGMFTYDATQHVPLLISGPGVTAEVVEQPVSLVDVTPTVMSILGLPVPDGLDGRPVPAAEPRPLYMESYELRDRFGIAPSVGLVDATDKYIDLPRPELYDLAADPGETADLSADPAHAARLAAMKATLDGLGFPAPGAQPTAVDPEVTAQLAELGYVQGSFSGDTSGPLPDPKDKKRVVGLSQRGERLEMEDKLEEANEVYATLIEENPEINEFRNRRAMLLSRLGEDKEALAVAREALSHDEDNPVLQASLAAMLGKSGAYDEAAKLYLSAAEGTPFNPRLRRSAVAALLSGSDGPAAGIKQGLAYLEKYPDDDHIAGLVGIGYWRTGEQDIAISYLERGVKADVPERDVAFDLAQAARTEGDVDRAVELLQLEVKNYPRNEMAARGLIAELSQRKDWAGVEGLARSQLAYLPDDPMMWHAEAQALFNLQNYADSRAVLDKALEKHPDDAALMLLDANLLAKEGDKERAQKRFEQAQAARERELGKKP
jgi:choline-sulfatase